MVGGGVWVGVSAIIWLLVLCLSWERGLDGVTEPKRPLFAVVTVTEAQRAKLPVTPMPREMAFPVPKGESWHDHYAHVRCVVLLSWRPGGGEQGTADADSSSAPAEVSKPQLRSTSAARSEERFPCGGRWA